MPINLSVNERLCLRIASFEGTVLSADLSALVTLFDQERAWLGYDSIYLLDADSIDVGPEQLDLLKRRIFAVYADVDPIVRRRSAWIFKNAHVRRLTEYWLTGRHDHDGSGTEFCIGADLKDARALFSEEELAAVETRAGFSQLARIGATT